MPAWTPTITSGTVDMPTTSAPMPRRKRYSARVSRFGPGTATNTPLWTDDLFLQGDALRQREQLAVVGPAHVGKADAEAVVVVADERIVADAG